MRFVLDNSVVCGWFLGAQSTPYSDAIAARLAADDKAIAPALLGIELTNVLRTAHKKQRINAGQAQELLAVMGQLPIETDTNPVGAGQLLALALRYDLTSYDATYLELALRLQLPVATQDAALAEAACIAGVGVVSA
jgi:predicted nucleic acid-binding protein